MQSRHMDESRFEPRLFRTTVPYYARYRLGYPDLLIERVIERAGLQWGDAVLDLGCGPGLLAIPFAKAQMRVRGMDPEPDMLAAAREAAREAAVVVDFRQGSSFDLHEGSGRFKLVAMGRSFHWMDRKETLEILDQIVVRDGAVAIFTDHHPDTVENKWREAVREIGSRYGAEYSQWRKRRRDPEYRSHESLLLDSPFSQVEETSIFVRNPLSIDEIIGRALSLSATSPEKLGARRAAFEDDLRAELARLSPGGAFTEVAQIGASIARRP
ncbi:MAG TPA: class I SAM-dependent methyltransferase [Rhizomicrobium sp.]|nr:class I SAM-dependent methyltransferase [Rhizomicrobium sp.]